MKCPLTGQEVRGCVDKVLPPGCLDENGKPVDLEALAGVVEHGVKNHKRGELFRQ